MWFVTVIEQCSATSSLLTNHTGFSISARETYHLITVERPRKGDRGDKQFVALSDISFWTDQQVNSEALQRLPTVLGRLLSENVLVGLLTTRRSRRYRRERSSDEPLVDAS
jgi:hypothetical protein